MGEPDATNGDFFLRPDRIFSCFLLSSDKLLPGCEACADALEAEKQRDEEVAQLLDLKIFIDAQDKIKLKRRIKRDNEERGYDLQDVMYRWKYHVKPTYEEYIRPHKRSCDIVIPNNHQFEKGLDVIVSYLKNQI